jgi:hypothetical protein
MLAIALANKLSRGSSPMQRDTGSRRSTKPDRFLPAIGVPCLIEAEVPIASLPDAAGLAFKIYSRFLVSRAHVSV